MKLEDKIKKYLGNGGLFNPELMEHEKVRDLILECQSEIQKLKLRVKNLKFNNDYVEEVEYKNSNLLAEVQKLTAVLEMVQDNTKMPHQHTDPQLRLYCLSERASEVLEKLK